MPNAAAVTVFSPRLSLETLRGTLLWLMGFAGAFVFIEPSPYEIVGILAITIFAVTGLTLRATLVPLILLLILLNIGYATAMLQVADQSKVVTWVLISAYLGATAVVYAAMLGANTQARLAWLTRGCMAAGLIASLAAIGAYFHLFGGLSDLFLLYGRARGTFNDPNVLGAFLVLPTLMAFQRMLAGRLSAALASGLILLVMLAALLLSFSRAAWGQFAVAALLLMGMTFATSRAPGARLRIVLIAIGGTLVALFLLAALLSIGQVADLFKERATLDQNYDLGHLGRFGRYILGFDLMLERPLGIGVLQFSKSYFSEDPHNTFLNTFMSGGWLGGLAYLALTLVTAVRGLRFVFVRTPWQPAYHVVYAAFLGVAGESAIIDIDHWRHYFLILGVLWGLMAATTHLRASAAARPYLTRP
jgi:O-antigen ligase